MIGPNDLPTVNAILNAISAFLLVSGYVAVRRRRIRLHQTCMLSALAVSTLFLTSYLYYHIVVRRGQHTVFGEDAHVSELVRSLYYAILTTHTVLAAIVAPLALHTAFLALRGRFDRHVRVARWTLPIWLYVSITGVIVYLMLYRLYPSPEGPVQ